MSRDSRSNNIRKSYFNLVCDSAKRTEIALEQLIVFNRNVRVKTSSASSSEVTTFFNRPLMPGLIQEMLYNSGGCAKTVATEDVLASLRDSVTPILVVSLALHSAEDQVPVVAYEQHFAGLLPAEWIQSVQQKVDQLVAKRTEQLRNRQTTALYLVLDGQHRAVYAQLALHHSDWSAVKVPVVIVPGCFQLRVLQAANERGGVGVVISDDFSTSSGHFPRSFEELFSVYSFANTSRETAVNNANLYSLELWLSLVRSLASDYIRFLETAIAERESASHQSAEQAAAADQEHVHPSQSQNSYAMRLLALLRALSEPGRRGRGRPSDEANRLERQLFTDIAARAAVFGQPVSYRELLEDARAAAAADGESSDDDNDNDNDNADHSRASNNPNAVHAADDANSGDADSEQTSLDQEIELRPLPTTTHAQHHDRARVAEPSVQLDQSTAVLPVSPGSLASIPPNPVETRNIILGPGRKVHLSLSARLLLQPELKALYAVVSGRFSTLTSSAGHAAASSVVLRSHRGSSSQPSQAHSRNTGAEREQLLEERRQLTNAVMHHLHEHSAGRFVSSVENSQSSRAAFDHEKNCMLTDLLRWDSAWTNKDPARNALRELLAQEPLQPFSCALVTSLLAHSCLPHASEHLQHMERAHPVPKQSRHSCHSSAQQSTRMLSKKELETLAKKSLLLVELLRLVKQRLQQSQSQEAVINTNDMLDKLYNVAHLCYICPVSYDPAAIIIPDRASIDTFLTRIISRSMTALSTGKGADQLSRRARTPPDSAALAQSLCAVLTEMCRAITEVLGDKDVTQRKSSSHSPFVVNPSTVSAVSAQLKTMRSSCILLEQHLQAIAESKREPDAANRKKTTKKAGNSVADSSEGQGDYGGGELHAVDSNTDGEFAQVDGNRAPVDVADSATKTVQHTRSRKRRPDKDGSQDAADDTAELWAEANGIDIIQLQVADSVRTLKPICLSFLRQSVITAAELETALASSRPVGKHLLDIFVVDAADDSATDEGGGGADAAAQVVRGVISNFLCCASNSSSSSSSAAAAAEADAPSSVSAAGSASASTSTSGSAVTEHSNAERAVRLTSVALATCLTAANHRLAHSVLHASASAANSKGAQLVSRSDAQRTHTSSWFGCAPKSKHPFVLMSPFPTLSVLTAQPVLRNPSDGKQNVRVSDAVVGPFAGLIVHATKDNPIDCFDTRRPPTNVPDDLLREVLQWIMPSNPESAFATAARSCVVVLNVTGATETDRKQHLRSLAALLAALLAAPFTPLAFDSASADSRHRSQERVDNLNNKLLPYQLRDVKILILGQHNLDDNMLAELSISLALHLTELRFDQDDGRSRSCLDKLIESDCLYDPGLLYVPRTAALRPLLLNQEDLAALGLDPALSEPSSPQMSDINEHVTTEDVGHTRVLYVAGKCVNLAEALEVHKRMRAETSNEFQSNEDNSADGNDDEEDGDGYRGPSFAVDPTPSPGTGSSPPTLGTSAAAVPEPQEDGLQPQEDGLPARPQAKTNVILSSSAASQHAAAQSTGGAVRSQKAPPAVTSSSAAATPKNADGHTAQAQPAATAAPHVADPAASQTKTPAPARPEAPRLQTASRTTQVSAPRKSPAPAAAPPPSPAPRAPSTSSSSARPHAAAQQQSQRSPSSSTSAAPEADDPDLLQLEHTTQNLALVRNVVSQFRNVEAWKQICTAAIANRSSLKLVAHNVQPGQGGNELLVLLSPAEMASGTALHLLSCTYVLYNTLTSTLPAASTITEDASVTTPASTSPSASPSQRASLFISSWIVCVAGRASFITELTQLSDTPGARSAKPHTASFITPFRQIVSADAVASHLHQLKVITHIAHVQENHYVSVSVVHFADLLAETKQTERPFLLIMDSLASSNFTNKQGLESQLLEFFRYVELLLIISGVPCPQRFASFSTMLDGLPRIRYHDTVQQEDGVSCGYHSLYNAILVSQYCDALVYRGEELQILGYDALSAFKYTTADVLRMRVKATMDLMQRSPDDILQQLEIHLQTTATPTSNTKGKSITSSSSSLPLHLEMWVTQNKYKEAGGADLLNQLRTICSKRASTTHLASQIDTVLKIQTSAADVNANSTVKQLGGDRLGQPRLNAINNNNNKNNNKNNNNNEHPNSTALSTLIPIEKSVGDLSVLYLQGSTSGTTYGLDSLMRVCAFDEASDLTSHDINLLHRLCDQHIAAIEKDDGAARALAVVLRADLLLLNDKTEQPFEPPYSIRGNSDTSDSCSAFVLPLSRVAAAVCLRHPRASEMFTLIFVCLHEHTMLDQPTRGRAIQICTEYLKFLGALRTKNYTLLLGLATVPYVFPCSFTKLQQQLFFMLVAHWCTVVVGVHIAFYTQAARELPRAVQPNAPRLLPDASSPERGSALAAMLDRDARKIADRLALKVCDVLDIVLTWPSLSLLDNNDNNSSSSKSGIANRVPLRTCLYACAVDLYRRLPLSTLAQNAVRSRIVNAKGITAAESAAITPTWSFAQSLASRSSLLWQSRLLNELILSPCSSDSVEGLPALLSELTQPMLSSTQRKKHGVAVRLASAPGGKSDEWTFDNDWIVSEEDKNSVADLLLPFSVGDSCICAVIILSGFSEYCRSLTERSAAPTTPSISVLSWQSAKENVVIDAVTSRVSVLCKLAMEFHSATSMRGEKALTLKPKLLRLPVEESVLKETSALWIISLLVSCVVVKPLQSTDDVSKFFLRAFDGNAVHLLPQHTQEATQQRNPPVPSTWAEALHSWELLVRLALARRYLSFRVLQALHDQQLTSATVSTSPRTYCSSSEGHASEVGRLHKELQLAAVTELAELAAKLGCTASSSHPNSTTETTAATATTSATTAQTSTITVSAQPETPAKSPAHAHAHAQSGNSTGANASSLSPHKGNGGQQSLTRKRPADAYEKADAVAVSASTSEKQQPPTKKTTVTAPSEPVPKTTTTTTAANTTIILNASANVPPSSITTAAEAAAPDNNVKILHNVAAERYLKARQAGDQELSQGSERWREALEPQKAEEESNLLRYIIDRKLISLPVEGDGNCFFYAIAWILVVRADLVVASEAVAGALAVARSAHRLTTAMDLVSGSSQEPDFIINLATVLRSVMTDKLKHYWQTFDEVRKSDIFSFLLTAEHLRGLSKDDKKALQSKQKCDMKNVVDTPEAYIERIRKPQEYVDDVCFQALADALGLSFTTVMAGTDMGQGKLYENPAHGLMRVETDPQFTIARHAGQHYSPLFRNEHVTDELLRRLEVLYQLNAPTEMPEKEHTKAKTPTQTNADAAAGKKRQSQRKQKTLKSSAKKQKK